ncbi:hypothetical protein PFISCL1PPCAC_12952, partial [Pristionchus fissidentatus]
QGFNVFLIGDSQAKLDEIRVDVESKDPEVELRPFVFDFADATRDDYGSLYKELGTIEVGFLVNNTELLSSGPAMLHEYSEGKDGLAKMSTVNTLPMMLLSASVLEQMSAREKGVIVNFSSMAGTMEKAYWSVLSASKKYVIHLSDVLREEYVSRGVVIQTITRGNVAATMNGEPSFFCPLPDRYSKLALRSIGIADKTAGYPSHQLQVELLSLVPHLFLALFMHIKNRKHRKSRRDIE